MVRLGTFITCCRRLNLGRICGVSSAKIRVQLPKMYSFPIHPQGRDTSRGGFIVVIQIRVFLKHQLYDSF
jgi:hypothetical protein